MSDLISRQDVIKVLKSNYDLLERATLRTDRARRDEISAMMAKIMLLPSAEPKTGEWIDRSDGGRIKYPWWESCKCNQCGEYGSGAYNFCPNCGAKMCKGGEEDD